jgi:hypothetical protein
MTVSIYNPSVRRIVGAYLCDLPPRMEQITEDMARQTKMIRRDGSITSFYDANGDDMDHMQELVTAYIERQQTEIRLGQELRALLMPIWKDRMHLPMREAIALLPAAEATKAHALVAELIRVCGSEYLNAEDDAEPAPLDSQ